MSHLGSRTTSSADDDPAIDASTALRRGPRIREEDVRQAADALLLDGGRPTVERVRSRLGRGSPNTIALYLDRWWNQLGARLRDLPGQELPRVPEPVAKALLSLWNQAIEQARTLLRESLAEQQADLDAQRTTVNTQRDELGRAQAEFARERAALEQTVALAQQQLAEVNERHRADVARLEELQRECAHFADQLQLARREAVEYAARVDVARQGHEDERRALQGRLDATEEHWAKQVDEARQALVAERKRLETIERQYAGELIRLREALQVAQTGRVQLETEFAHTRNALAAAQVECEQLKAVARKHEARADEALKGFQEAQVTAREQFETLARQLREALGRPGRSRQSGRRRLSDSSKKSNR